MENYRSDVLVKVHLKGVYLRQNDKLPQIARILFHSILTKGPDKIKGVDRSHRGHRMLGTKEPLFRDDLTYT